MGAEKKRKKVKALSTKEKAVTQAFSPFTASRRKPGSRAQSPSEGE
jgi:hypothetical protein